MDRLITYPDSIPSFKIHPSSTILSRIPRLPYSASSPSPFTSHSYRLKPLSCSLHQPSFIPHTKIDDLPQINLSSSADSVKGSETHSTILKLSSQILSRRRKVFKASRVIVLSAGILTLLSPVIHLPALASFPIASPAAVAAGSSSVRTELLSSAWTGFLAGCLHTLSGPDHLAALAPLSIGRTRMESAIVGALWGCGHDAGQVIFGLLFLLLKERLHIEIIRTWGTRVVGLTLLAIGGMGIREASEVPAPCITTASDVSGYEAAAVTSQSSSIAKKKIGFATFATGIIHGLQPDALMMILPALALPSRLAGAAFLLMFLVGTVVAMGSYTVFLGSCSEALKDRVPRFTEKLTLVSSVIAIGLGVAILLSQFLGFSLY